MCNGRWRPRGRAQGVALISVLLVVAILMAITSRLMARHHLVISAHQNSFESDQALHYALGAETLAIQALVEDFQRLGVGVDHQGEVWAQQVMPFELDEGGFVEAQVRDLHGCFNVTSLSGSASKDQVTRFKKLLGLLELPEQIAESMKDWVDADQDVTGFFGAEDSEYLIAIPPHRTPNNTVLSLSEFRLLPGMEAEMLQRLLPHICLLPESDSEINVNTVNALTLAALDPDLNLESAESITSAPRAFDAVTGFTDQHPNLSQVSNLGVRSRYFRMHAQVQVGEAMVMLESLLLRDPNSGQVTVLQRDFGKLFISNLQLIVDEST